MLTVSEAYKTAIMSKVRDVRALVLLDFNTNWALPFCTIVADTTAEGYLATQFNDGRIKVSENGYTGDLVPTGLDTPKVGWKGTAISDDEGILDAFEIITVTYNAPILVTNYWLLSDKYNYPVNFLMEVYTGATWVTLVDVTGNTASSYYYRHAAQTITAFRLTITKIKLPAESAFVIESGAITTVVFDDQDLMNISLLEEVAPETNKPFGSVSANECSCVIANLAGRFLPSNSNGPFFGLLRPSIRFRPFIGVEIAPFLFELVPLGIFYSEDWTCSSNTTRFALSGYDALAEITELDTPTMRGVVDISLTGLVELLLDNVGFNASQRTIDAALDSINLVFGYLPNDKIRVSFEQICIAGLCVICMDRIGKIAVRQIDSTGTSLVTWTDHDAIISIDNPQQFNDVFSSVVVKYYNPIASSEKELLSMSLDTVAGVVVWGPYSFDNPPVAVVTSVQLEPFTDFNIPVVKYGTNEMTLSVDNTGSPVTVNVSVMGKEMVINKLSKTFVNTDLITSVSKTTTVDGVLIQSGAAATSLGEDFLAFVSDPTNKLVIQSRGDPALELLDVIRLDDVSDNLGVVGAIVYRTTLSWDGALSSTISARKVGLIA